MLQFLSPLALIPTPYKLLAIALAVAAVAWFSYHKGVEHQKGLQAVAQVKYIDKIVEKTVKVVEKDAKEAAKFANERESLRGKNRALEQRVAELIASRPKYTECKTDPDVMKELNEALAGEKK